MVQECVVGTGVQVPMRWGQGSKCPCGGDKGPSAHVVGTGVQVPMKIGTPQSHLGKVTPINKATEDPTSPSPSPHNDTHHPASNLLRVCPGRVFRRRSCGSRMTWSISLASSSHSRPDWGGIAHDDLDVDTATAGGGEGRGGEGRKGRGRITDGQTL